jgi:hypothetical protein
VITQPAAPQPAGRSRRAQVAIATPHRNLRTATRSAEDVFAQVSMSVARVNALDGLGRMRWSAAASSWRAAR